MSVDFPRHQLSLLQVSQVHLPGNAVSSTYCPAQNCLVSFLSDGSLAALDVSTGSILQRTQPVADPQSCRNSWKCDFLPSAERLVISDGRRIGARRDLSGVFLLDSILQDAGNENLMIELPLSEVQTLLTVLLQFRKNPASQGSQKPYQAIVINQLEEAQIRHGSCGWQKAAKWDTTVLRLTSSDMLDMLVDAFSGCSRNSSEMQSLPLLSLLRDRLQRLAGSSVDLSSIPEPAGMRCTKSLMESELQRLKTFHGWPQMNHKWALPAPMARAGFYYHPTALGDDRVLCFSCGVCLAYWEPTDEPWSEHERHGGQQCRFIRGVFTWNVPLTSSLATAVASPVACSQSKGDTATPVSYHSAEAVVVMSTGNTVSISDLQLDQQLWATFTPEPFKHILSHLMKDGFDEQFSAGDEEMLNSLMKTEDESTGAATVAEGTGQKAVAITSLLDSILEGTNCSPAILHGLCRICTDLRRAKAQTESCDLSIAETMEVSYRSCSLFSATRQAGLNQAVQPVTVLCDDSVQNGPFWTVPQWPHMCNLTKAEVLVVAVVSLPGSTVASEVLLLIEVSPSSQFVCSPMPVPAGSGSGSTGTTFSPPPLPSQGVSVTPFNILTSGKPSSNIYPWMLDQMDDLVPVDKNDYLTYDSDPVLMNSIPPAFHIVNTPGGNSASAGSQTAAQTSSTPESSSASMGTRIVAFGTLHPDGANDELRVQSLYPVDHLQAVVVLSPVDKPVPHCRRADGASCICVARETESMPDKDRSSCIVLFRAAMAKGSGELERIASLHLGSTCCSIVSSCIIPKVLPGQNCRNDGAGDSPSCLLACTLSCNRLVLVDIPSLAIVGECELLEEDVEDIAAHDVTSSGMAQEPQETAPEQPDESSVGVINVAAASSAVSLTSSTTVTSTASPNTGALDQSLSTDTSMTTPLENTGPVVTYCSGLEQLCVVNGSRVSFLELESLESGKPEHVRGMDASERQPRAKLVLNNKTVCDLLLATQFEPYNELHRVVRISPPPSWEEVSQEQLLRRQPQHLQQTTASASTTPAASTLDLSGDTLPPLSTKVSSAMASGRASPVHDASPSSGLQWRTFRVLRDSAMANSPEQMFEIIVPRHGPLARVDVKFRLKENDPTSSSVLVLLTLLQSSTGSRQGRQPVETDDLSSQPWPIAHFTAGTVNEFVADSGASVICGPVALQSGLDGLGPTGHVSLTPPSQVAPGGLRTTSFYLHFSSVPTSGGELSSTPMAFGVEDIMITALQWTDEVSPYLGIPLSDLRLQLANEEGLWRALISQALGANFDGSQYATPTEKSAAFGSQQSQAMELLLWVAGIWSTHPKSPLIAIVEERCEELVSTCFVHGTRSLAHQCSQLFLFCTGCFTVQSSNMVVNREPFQERLCSVLLRATPSLLASAVRGASEDALMVDDSSSPVDVGCTAGAAQWFFTGLSSLCGDVSASTVIDVLVPLLATVVTLLREKRLSMDPNDADLRRAHDLLSQRFGLDQLPLEMAVFDAVAATGPPLVPAKATTTSSASGSGAGGAGGGFAVGAFGNSGGAGLGAASGDPGMPPLFFAGPTGKYNAAQAPPVPTSFTNTADLKASLLSTSINFPPLGPGLHGPSVVGTSGATKDQGDDATAIHPKAEKFLKAYLFGASRGGEESSALRQGTFPALAGLLEVFPLPFTIHHHSSGVHPGLNAESFLSRLDAEDIDLQSADSRFGSLKDISGQLRHHALHERLVTATQIPHTFLFDHISSGERHTIVLDLGHDVSLTDLIIFPCAQLSSVAVHVWSSGGSERLSKRLAVCTDIAQRSLVLNDLCPKLMCRFVKIVVIGALGGSHVNSRLTIGGLFGHLKLEALLPTSDDSGTAGGLSPREAFLNAYADLESRYIGSSELLLQQVADMSGAYNDGLPNARPAVSDMLATYHLCCTQKVQMSRLRHSLLSYHRYPSASSRTPPGVDSGTEDVEATLASAPVNVLQALASHLVSCLLSLCVQGQQQSDCNSASPQTDVTSTMSDNLDFTLCKHIMEELCVFSTSPAMLPINAGALVLQACSRHDWWPSLLKDVISEKFASDSQAPITSQSLYLVLCNFVNLSSSKVLPAIVEKCVELLHEHLAPLAKTGNKGGKTLSPDAWSQVDLKFLTWLLMFISHFLDLLQEDLNTSSDPTRFSWDFVAPSGRPAAGSQSQPHGGGDSRQRMKDSFKELRRRFKAKLHQHEIPDAGGKVEFASGEVLSASSSPYRPSTPSSYASQAASNSPPSGLLEPTWRLDSKYCVSVLRRLMVLIESMDMLLNAETYMLTCKVVGRLARCCSPPLSVANLIDRSSLLSLLQTCVAASTPSADSLDQPLGTSGMAAGWSGPWAVHALLGMFLDMMMAERTWISQAYPQCYLVDDSSRASNASPKNTRSARSRTPPAFGSSLVEASRTTLDSVCNILNNLAVPQSTSSSSSSVKLNSQIATLTYKSQHLRAKLDAMKSSQHHAMFTGKLKDMDAKIARLKYKVLAVQNKAADLHTSSGSGGSPGATFAGSTLKISSEHSSRVELSMSSVAENALRSLVHCQHVSSLHLWRCAIPVEPSSSEPSSAASSAESASDAAASKVSTPPTKAVLDHALRQACSVQFLLCHAFDTLFQGLSDQSDLESLLEFWLQLNPASGCGVTFVGAGALNLAPETLLHILRVAASRAAQLTLRTWALLFHLLASVCYLSPCYRRGSKDTTSSANLAVDGWQSLIGHPLIRSELANVLCSFLCLPSVNGSHNVGPMVVHIMETFLMHFTGMSGMASGREGSPACIRLDQQEMTPVALSFKHEAHVLLCQVLLDLVNASVLGQGGAVDAQQGFVAFLLTCTSLVTRVDPVVLRLWHSMCTLAKSIGPTLHSSVFCSGGLAAKLEEKGKSVPSPQHRGYLAAVEPILCNIMWLVLGLVDRPVVSMATGSMSPGVGTKESEMEDKLNDWLSRQTQSSTPFGGRQLAEEVTERQVSAELDAELDTELNAELDTSSVEPSVPQLPEESSQTVPVDGSLSPASDQIQNTEQQLPEDSPAAAASAADSAGSSTAGSTCPSASSSTASCDAEGVDSETRSLGTYLLMGAVSLHELITCLNLCPWWHRPPSLPPVSDLANNRFRDAGQLVYRSCQKSALDLAKQSELFPSVLMSVLSTLWQYCMTAAEAGKEQVMASYVRAIVGYLCGDAPTAANDGRSNLNHHPVKMSEPVLVLVCSVLSSTVATTIDFIEKGGLSGLASYFVASTVNRWNFQPSDVSYAMQAVGSLSSFPPCRRNPGREQDNRTAFVDKEDAVVLRNFAPYGQISSSPYIEGSDSLDVLLAPTAPYRRARAASWSHRFSSHSTSWISLTIQLPVPILLKIVQVTAHALSLANAPSCVLVEAAKAPSGMLPVGSTIPSSGCGCTRIELLEPKIVTAVCIRLKRPVDSDTLSLTHIGLYGTAAFSCSLSFAPLGQQAGRTASGISALPLAHVGPSSIGWLRCLSMCLDVFSCMADESEIHSSSVSAERIAGAAAEVSKFADRSDVVQFLLGVFQNPMSVGCHGLLEDILVTLIGLSESFSVALTKCLLACSAAVPDLTSEDCPWSSHACGRFVSGEAALHLIYVTCTHRDKYSAARCAILVHWLCCLPAMSTSGLHRYSQCLPMRIQAVASTLFQMHDVLSPDDGPLLTEDTFKKLLSFTKIAVGTGKCFGDAARNALGCMAHLRPDYFQPVLSDILAGVQEGSRSSDAYVMLECLCSLVQSPECLQHLLSSDFLDAVTGQIHANLHESKISHTSCQHATKLLNCLSTLCRDCSIQDSLSGERTVFWQPLLRRTMCTVPGLGLPSPSRHVRGRHYLKLLAAAVQFFSAVTSGHASNTDKFILCLCEELRDEQVQPNAGFARELITSLLLQSESVRVVLRPVQLSALPGGHLQDSDCQKQVGNHLSWPVGRGVLVRELSICSSMLQLSETLLPSKPSPTSSSTASAVPATGGTATPTANAPPLDSVQLAPAFKNMLKGEYAVYDDDFLEMESKWSSVVKQDQAPKVEEAQPVSVLPAVLFRTHRSEQVLEAAWSLGDVLEHTPGLSSCSASGMLFYSRNNWSEKGKETEGTVSALTPSLLAAKLRSAHGEGLGQTSFTLLKAFAEHEGLKVLAHRLPCGYGSVERLVTSSDEEPCLPDFVPTLPPFDRSVWPSSNTRLPGHTLAALPLFLRLPCYADSFVLLNSQAATLLRLLLGIPCESGVIRSPAGKACSIPALSLLPFVRLVDVLRSRSLSCTSGFVVRAHMLHGGVLHFLLASLAHLSHSEVNSSGSEPASLAGDGDAGSMPQQSASGDVIEKLGMQSKAGPDGKLYWAKGTGFGTGSTHSTWDVNQAVSRQKKEETHITALLEILAEFFDCSKTEPEHGAQTLFDQEWLVNLLKSSCLLPLLRSYLCNDSVLDMSCHLLVHAAVLSLVRSISSCDPLKPLLLLSSSSSSPDDLAFLLRRMKSYLDTYSQCLGKQKPNVAPSKARSDKQAKGSGTEPSQAEANTEGITSLVLDIGWAYQVVEDSIQGMRKSDGESGQSDALQPVADAASVDSDDYYVSQIKLLQFDSHLMVEEDEVRGQPRCLVDFHYESLLYETVSVSAAATRAHRLAQEMSTLSTSLPVSSGSSVFVRVDEERLDIMKVLITGPEDTPYFGGCFEFDVFFPGDYPSRPMKVNLATTGKQTVRFNPNLYNDGKVCLSVLNTWHGRPEEKWNPATSSLLQVLVSIQSLILVPEPYFNEPGYERSRNTAQGDLASLEYNANIKQATIRWAMLEQLRNTPPAFADVIRRHFFLKQKEIVAEAEKWVADASRLVGKKRLHAYGTAHVENAKRHLAAMKVELAKLKDEPVGGSAAT